MALEPPSRKKTVKTLEHREHLLKQFKEMWYQEYLLSLRETCKDLHEVSFENKLKVNDVVLVKGPPMTKRPYWTLGRVVELIPGYDQKVRSVKILKGDGATGTITTHSLKHLYPMELSLTHSHQANEPHCSVAMANDSVAGSSNLVEPVMDLVREEADAPIVNSAGSDPIGDSLEQVPVLDRPTLEPVEQGTEADSVQLEVVPEDPDNVVVTSRRPRRIKHKQDSNFAFGLVILNFVLEVLIYFFVEIEYLYYYFGI